MSNIATRTAIRPFQVIPVRFGPVWPGKPGVPGGFDSSVSLPEMVTSFEAITPNSGGSTHAWKAFHHYESYSGSNPAGRNSVRLITNRHASDNWGTEECWAPDTSYGLTSAMFGDLGTCSNGLPNWYQPTLTGDGFVPAPANLAELKQASFNVLLPVIKSEMSLLNSLYELKDLKSLASQARSIATTIKILRNKWSKGKLPRTVRELASGHLQYAFNLSPLYSDIKAFYKAFDAAMKRINYFMTRQGRVQTRHYIWRFVPHESQTDYTGWSHPGPADDASIGSQTVVRFRRDVSKASGIFHAQIEYNYRYSRFQQEHAPFLAWLDSLGVNLNPSIIWNAMKYTFIIDWLLGVSKWLDQYKTSWMEPQINIRRYLWSVRYERNIDLTAEYRSDLCYGASIMYDSKVSLPSCRQVAYRRQPDVVSASSITSSGLTLNEVSLGASLLLSRKWKTRKR